MQVLALVVKQKVAAEDIFVDKKTQGFLERCLFPRAGVTEVAVLSGERCTSKEEYVCAAQRGAILEIVISCYAAFMQC